MKTILSGLTLALLAALTCGCAEDATQGYTMASQYPADVRTVAVTVFWRAKNVYRRDIEFDLTEATVKRMELDTPYKQTVRERADTELTATIEKIDQQVTSFDPKTGVPRELLVTMTVSYKWKDLRAAKRNKERKKATITVTGNYIPEAPVGETFFVGEQSVVNQAARRIVEGMESRW